MSQVEDLLAASPAIRIIGQAMVQPAADEVLQAPLHGRRRQVGLDAVAAGQPQQQVHLPVRAIQHRGRQLAFRVPSGVEVQGHLGQQVRRRSLAFPHLGQLGAEQLPSHRNRVEFHDPAGEGLVKPAQHPGGRRRFQDHAGHRRAVVPLRLRIGPLQPPEQGSRVASGPMPSASRRGHPAAGSRQATRPARRHQ